MEKTHTIQRGGAIKNLSPMKTGDRTKKDHLTIQIDTISIQIAIKGPLGMTTIIGMKVRVMTAGGEMKVMFPGGLGPTATEERPRPARSAPGALTTAAARHKNTTETLPTHMLGAK